MSFFKVRNVRINNPSQTIPLWSTGQDTSLPNRKAMVWTQCSVNAFEPKDLNLIRNPLLTVKAVALWNFCQRYKSLFYVLALSRNLFTLKAVTQSFASKICVTAFKQHRDYCRMNWNSLAFFSKLKRLDVAKCGSNIIWASSKNTHFLKIWGM